MYLLDVVLWSVEWDRSLLLLEWLLEWLLELLLLRHHYGDLSSELSINRLEVFVETVDLFSGTHSPHNDWLGDTSWAIPMINEGNITDSTHRHRLL
jgi:hypothetical protein